MSATDEIPITSEKHEEILSIDPALMKTLKIGASLVIIALCVMMIVAPLMGAYNTLVDSDIQVNRAAHNVQTDLQRRADLLPNLAATVKGSADFEYKTQYNTFVQVAEARAQASKQLKSNIASASPTDLAAGATNVDSQLTMLGNFVKLQEEYPTLKLDTVQQFREFSAQVTATENQILVDRQTYNAAVSQYQSVVRSFPTNLIAGYYGYSPDKYQMYIPKDQARAEAVPTITFDFSNL